MWYTNFLKCIWTPEGRIMSTELFTYLCMRKQYTIKNCIHTGHLIRYHRSEWGVISLGYTDTLFTKWRCIHVHHSFNKLFQRFHTSNTAPTRLNLHDVCLKIITYSLNPDWLVLKLHVDVLWCLTKLCSQRHHWSSINSWIFELISYLNTHVFM